MAWRNVGLCMQAPHELPMPMLADASRCIYITLHVLWLCIPRDVIPSCVSRYGFASEQSRHLGLWCVCHDMVARQWLLIGL